VETLTATQSIVVLDFGSAIHQLIARRIREQNVFSVVLPCTASLEEIKSLRARGIVLKWRSLLACYDADAPPADERRAWRSACPCSEFATGFSSLTTSWAAKCAAPPRSASTATRHVQVLNGSPLFKDLPRELEVWMSHGDEGIRTSARFRV